MDQSLNNAPGFTPPPELVEQWFDEANTEETMADVKEAFATRAAQWGADQELEACIDWISVWHGLEHPELLIKLLRAACRPKPPSLKEQALQALNDAVKMADDTPPEGICSDQANIIRRALEQLDD
jgi:hypothetical protein